MHKLAILSDIHGCLPLGAEAQELEPWEETPCFSGFSPQVYVASDCQIPPFVVQLFVYEAPGREGLQGQRLVHKQLNLGGSDRETSIG